MTGVPVVGLATTEMVTVIENGTSGILHTDIQYLIREMKTLIEDRDLAMRLGEAGRQVAIQRFNISRFIQEWEQLIQKVVAVPTTFHKANISETLVV
jgi:glycosyltransferase involved in cell wall biosynthesis